MFRRGVKQINVLEQAIDLFQVGHIAERCRDRRLRLAQRIERLLVDVADMQPRPRLGKCIDKRAADSRRTRGHENAFIFH